MSSRYVADRRFIMPFIILLPGKYSHLRHFVDLGHT